MEISFILTDCVTFEEFKDTKGTDEIVMLETVKTQMCLMFKRPQNTVVVLWYGDVVVVGVCVRTRIGLLTIFFSL